MITIESIARHAHRVNVMAEFRQADVEELLEFVKQRNADGGGGNLLIDVTSMAGFSWSAVMEEIGHMGAFMKYVYALDRIAIISDEAWMRTAARLESILLPGVEYQVYDDDEAETALAWVLEEVDEPHLNAFQELDLGDPSIAAFQLAGRLDSAESERGIAMVEARLRDPECTRLMMVIKSWHGFDAELLFDFGLMRSKLGLIDEIERYAIVGGPSWIGGTAQIMGALVKPDIRSFDEDEQDEAVAWLSGDD